MNSKKTNYGSKNLFSFVGALGIGALMSLPVLAQYYYPPSSFFLPTANNFQSDEPCYDVTETVNIADNLKGNECYETLVSYLEEADLSETLTQKETLTIFAPREDAFESLDPDIRAKLSQPENLVKVLKYHVVSDLITEDRIKQGEVVTLEGNSIKITGYPINGNEKKIGVQLNEAKAGDPMKASNGVIVPIDKVLLPPDLQLEPQS